MLIKALPGTRIVYANQLEIGDNIVKNDTGEFDSSVEDVFTDSYGTWLDTGDTIGYLDSRMQFMIEWAE